MTDETEWLSPVEALALLEPEFGPSAKAYVADKLKEGQVRARAEQMWESHEPTITAAWKNREIAEAQVEVDIAPSLWRSSRHWSYDLDLWRWERSRFVVTRRKKPADRTILTGLSFAAQDILKLVPTGKRLSSRAGVGGAPKRIDAWTVFWHAVIQIAREERLQPGQFSSQAQLREEILEILGPGGLKEDTIKPFVQQIWHKFLVLPKPDD